jgi:hypothetical protein
MRKITYEEVKNLHEYERVREEFRRHTIEVKRPRRVQAGDLLSFLFENRETVLFQVQEMLRTERIVKEEAVRFEVDVYNQLIPDDDELSATMFIEITDQARVQEELDRLMGIDGNDTVFLQIGNSHRVYGIFEAGRSKEDKISAVHYVRFPFGPQEKGAFLDLSREVHLVVDHPRYQAKALLPPRTRKVLAEDLLSTAR